MNLAWVWRCSQLGVSKLGKQHLGEDDIEHGPGSQTHSASARGSCSLDRPDGERPDVRTCPGLSLCAVPSFVLVCRRGCPEPVPAERAGGAGGSEEVQVRVLSWSRSQQSYWHRGDRREQAVSCKAHVRDRYSSGSGRRTFVTTVRGLNYF